MARPNPPRSIGGEDNLAVRIAQEREERELSYEALATQMTDVGCPIQPSALHRIEKGSPRRRVTVDELIALSRVFEVPVSDLLTDVELLRREKLREVVDGMEPAQKRLTEAYTDFFEAYYRFFELAVKDPDGWEYVFRHWFPDHDVEDRTLGERPPDGDFEDVDPEDAVTALSDLIGLTWRAAAAAVRADLDAGKWD